MTVVENERSHVSVEHENMALKIADYFERIPL